jgi:hypothetical protein
MSARRFGIVRRFHSHRYVFDKEPDRFFNRTTANPDLIGSKPACFSESMGFAAVSFGLVASRENIVSDPIIDKLFGPLA